MTFIAGFPQTDFDTKLVNFFLKLGLPVILKELRSNFLISTLRLFQKLSYKWHYLVLGYFSESFLVGVYRFPSKFLP